jgi:prepilin-type processing-associated H-X9-DG protein
MLHPRRAIALWHVILTLASIGLLAAIFLPVVLSFNSDKYAPDKGRICQSNLKQIMLGVKQYMQDYDEKYPPVATSAKDFGWAGSLQPYLKSTQIFQCPLDLSSPPDSTPDPVGPQYTDYWYNSRLAAVKEDKIEYPALIIALGDGNDGKDITDARYHLDQLPEKWRINGSPLYRHNDGSNIAFADGHVKWIAAKSWKSGLAVDDYVFKIGK